MRISKLIPADERHKELDEIGNKDYASVFTDENENTMGYLWYEYPHLEMSAEYDCTTLYINFIKATVLNAGIGKQMIAFIFQNFKIDRIIGETNDENKGFWIKIGAEMPNIYKDDVCETYNFELKREIFTVKGDKMKCLTTDKALLDLICQYENNRREDENWNNEKEQTYIFLVELYEKRQLICTINKNLKSSETKISVMINSCQDEKGLIII